METNTTQVLRLLPRDYDVFVGLDTHKSELAASFLDHADRLTCVSMPSDATALLAYVRKRFDDERLAFVYEAGPCGWGLYDRLTAAGYPCLVAAPQMVPSAPGDQVKTNRRDSRKLALALRAGEITSVRVPPDLYRELRHYLAARRHQTQAQRACKQRIKMLLLLEGLAFPAGAAGSSWSASVVEALRAMACSPATRVQLDGELDALAFHAEQAKKVRQAILAFCKREPDLAESLRYLRSVPGIGEIIALHVLSRVGDWRLLGRPEELGALFGLVPREHSTGDRVRRGAITKGGLGWIRAMVIEGAWTAIRKDAALRAFYCRVYARHPRQQAAQKAITAVARKLCVYMGSVLKERRMFETRPVDA